jgi:hypothetical protein
MGGILNSKEPLAIYGDFPFVPLEMRPARKWEGGASEHSGRADEQGDSIARHHKIALT